VAIVVENQSCKQYKRKNTSRLEGKNERIEGKEESRGRKDRLGGSPRYLLNKGTDTAIKVLKAKPQL